MRIVAKGHIVLSRRLIGAFYDEKCPCPSDLETFYTEYKCPESFDQLDADLAKFPGTFDLDELLKCINNKYNIIVLIPQKYEEVEILPFALNLIKVNQME